MSGLLSYVGSLLHSTSAGISATADDIATIAGKTVASSMDNISSSFSKTAATSLDDVAHMAGTATTKTGSILIDDTAAMSNATDGSAAERELPIIWEIAKGSFKNKAIIIPGVLLASAVAPVVIPVALAAGGAYLSYEAAEVIIDGVKEKLGMETHEEKHGTETNESQEEREKKIISGSIKTDGVLSLEIIIMALSTVTAAPFLIQAGVISVVGVATTVGVYGVVGGIVKMDDIGLHLQKSDNAFVSGIGKGLVTAMPKVIKSLSVIGTAAMAIVGGSILAHHIPMLHHAVQMTEHLPGMLSTVGAIGTEMVAGGIIGAGLVGAHKLVEPVIDWVKEHNPFRKKDEPEEKLSQEKLSDIKKSIKKELDNEIGITQSIDNETSSVKVSQSIDDSSSSKSQSMKKEDSVKPESATLEAKSFSSELTEKVDSLDKKVSNQEPNIIPTGRISN